MDTTNNLLDNQIEAKDSIPFYSPSTFRFISLYVLSFGIYNIYWLFKNWVTLIKVNNLNWSPFWRSLFAIIFIISFGINVKYELLKHDIKLRWNPILIGILYIGVYFLYKLPSPYWMLSALSFLPLLLINNSLKEINVKNGFNRNMAKKLSWWSIIIIVLLCAFYALVIIGLIDEHMNII